MGGTNKNKKAPKNRNTTKKNKKSDIKLLTQNALDRKYFKLYGYGEPTMNKRNNFMNKNMKLRGPMP